jgi:inosine/xanthosine triphosphate pyrophosphatase family protein
MKNFVILFCIIFIVASVTATYAQLSKQEKKEWKKKAKALKKNPEELKNLYDENAALKSEISGYKRQISSLEGQVKEKDNQLASMTQKMRSMEQDLATAQQAAAVRQETGVVYDDSGVVFKVQIGAFRDRDMSKYFDNTENFTGEEDAGVQKITLGRFRDYWEADTFKKYLREMGVGDAWIVPYKDGKRVAMKDVLEGVI